MTSDDQIFAAVEQLDADLKSPARSSIHRSGAGPVDVVSAAGGPVQPDSEGGRAGGVSPALGAVSEGFVLPNSRVPLAFEPGEHRLVGKVRVLAPGYDALPSRTPVVGALDRGWFR